MVIRKPSVQKVASSELGRIALRKRPKKAPERKRPKETARKKPIEEIDQTHQYYGSEKHSKPRANTDSPRPGRHGALKHSLLPSL